ncbi:sialidase family protein [Rhodopirellula halodulae]|uniref:sialidase family protein n=1 Tax=Rhodopirellula halodulae TaxID=2894198 RepID=UPI001E322EF7|nr:sialidase family protein [Rhodopirellula sp. JC737]MCC9658640.1 glycoside hydrolase [Rhodopirellula sp. JC737]
MPAAIRRRLPAIFSRQIFAFAILAGTQLGLATRCHLSAAESTGTAHDRHLVDVFVPGEDGYPAIRIPSLVTTKAGTLLAFAEGRQGGDHSENDLIAKRSVDGGKTWGDLLLIREQGALSLNNPQAVVLESGRILVMYQQNRLGEHRANDGYGPDSYFTFIQTSDDDGLTWSEPLDVSRQVKREHGVTSVAAGPGIGIVLQRGPHPGRIVMPFNQGPYGDWRVYAAYSDDDGASWKMGDVAPGDGKGHGNEVQMVELSDGRLMLNARTQGAGTTKFRKVATSSDAGESWTQLQSDEQLIEPTCQAALLRYSWPEDGTSRILFSNPATQTKRANGVLRVSYDEGKTWPAQTVIYPDGFAYSCLTRMSDGRVGVLFERDGYRAISFVAISMDELEKGSQKNGADSDAAGEQP